MGFVKPKPQVEREIDGIKIGVELKGDKIQWYVKGKLNGEEKVIRINERQYQLRHKSDEVIESFDAKLLKEHGVVLPQNVDLKKTIEEMYKEMKKGD